MTLLLLEMLFIAGVLITLDRLPHPYSVTMMAVFVGSNQFLQTILASTVYVQLVPGVTVSPGSVALFSSNIVAVLLVYMRHDVPQTRALIYGVLVSNLTLSVFSFITTLQLGAGATNLMEINPALFQLDVRVFASGTLTLVVDSILVVVAYEGLRSHAPRLPAWARMVAVLVGVFYVDALLFSALAFGGTPLLQTVLESQLVGKSVSGLFFGLSLVLYTVITPASPGEDTREPFGLLTYKQRFEDERQARLKADEENVAKSHFLARMSHELRTPLNSIIGFSSRLLKARDGPISPRQAQFLERILANGGHLLGLIDDILDLSRVEAGKLPFLVEPVDIGSLVESLSSELSGGIDPDGPVTLHVTVPGSLLPVRSDPMRMRQIVTNLLANALKFTAAGEVHLEVHADAGVPTRITVRDTGVGIASDRLGHIFDAFTQADESTTRQHGGTGLGLTISAALCRELGHRLEVTSEEGVGSTFTIVL